MDIYGFYTGKIFDAHYHLGVHKERDRSGYMFRVYAPHAERVTLVGEFNDWQDWETYPSFNEHFREVNVPQAKPGDRYLYRVWNKDGSYTELEDVAYYLHTYGHLPSNFVTKKEAKAAGWTGGSLEPWFPGCVIGGDYFGNYEGLLPKKKGRTYYECDIDTKGKRSRGARRIIFSNDGYIYYTDDHYESFTELYKGGAS